MGKMDISKIRMKNHEGEEEEEEEDDDIISTQIANSREDAMKGEGATAESTNQASSGKGHYDLDLKREQISQKVEAHVKSKKRSSAGRTKKEEVEAQERVLDLPISGSGGLEVPQQQQQLSPPALRHTGEAQQSVYGVRPEQSINDGEAREIMSTLSSDLDHVTPLPAPDYSFTSTSSHSIISTLTSTSSLSSILGKARDNRTRFTADTPSITTPELTSSGEVPGNTDLNQHEAGSEDSAVDSGQRKRRKEKKGRKGDNGDQVVAESSSGQEEGVSFTVLRQKGEAEEEAKRMPPQSPLSEREGRKTHKARRTSLLHVPPGNSLEKLHIVHLLVSNIYIYIYIYILLSANCTPPCMYGVVR